MNTRTVRVRPETLDLIKDMKEKISTKDKYAKVDNASIVDRAVRYWLYGDVDK